MHRYKIRTHLISSFGEGTWDYHLESSELLEEFAGRLALRGFKEPNGDKWIMPGAIMWIEAK